MPLQSVTVANFFSLNADGSFGILPSGFLPRLCFGRSALPDLTLKAMDDDPLSAKTKTLLLLFGFGLAAICFIDMPSALTGFYLFPVGLLTLFRRAPGFQDFARSTPSLFVAPYLLYIIVVTAAYRSKRSAVFGTVYFLFFILLVFNVAGCRSIISEWKSW
jgi:hypothetical protein